MSSWEYRPLSDFLTAREERYKPNDSFIASFKRINKIDFTGQIHILEKPTRTDMIVVNPGDLVISGINVAKGALAVYEGDEPVVATIHYSSYTFDKNKIDIDFLKRFLKSPSFIIELQNQVKGGIKTEIKPKHLLPLKLKIPNLAEQQIINRYFNAIENEAIYLSNEITTQSSYITKLRQAILQEAIEGKLTADWRKENPVRKGDPDYDSEALLVKIQAEKEKLIKEGKIKKQKPLAPIKAEEVPFELPEGWVWTRLGKSGWIGRGKSPVYSEESDSIVLNQKCIRWFQIETMWGKSVSEKWLNSIEKSIFTKIGDILVNSTGEGTIGRAAIVDEKSANLLYDSHVLKYSTLINNRHILACLNSMFCQSQIEECKGAKTTKQTELGVDNLSNLLIPLPPLAEQQAIVDRVEKLLSMVDELEKQVSERKEQSEQLMQAVLREAFEGKPTISENKTLEVNNA